MLGVSEAKTPELQPVWERGADFTYLGLGDLLFVSADTTKTKFAVAAGRAVGPREVTRLAHQLATGLAGAPEPVAGHLNERTGLGTCPEGQFTLAVKAVGDAGQHI